MIKSICFDWALKKFLRHESYFDVLEGFLSEMLGEDIIIKEIIEPGFYEKTEENKPNLVDMLCFNSKDELIIIEMQNFREIDYMHRIHSGTPKASLEHISNDSTYDGVKNTFDEWVYFLKNESLPRNHSAKGLKKAAEVLDIKRMSEEERKEYERYLEKLRYQASMFDSTWGDGYRQAKEEHRAREELANHMLLCC